MYVTRAPGAPPPHPSQPTQAGACSGRLLRSLWRIFSTFYWQKTIPVDDKRSRQRIYIVLTWNSLSVSQFIQWKRRYLSQIFRFFPSNMYVWYSNVFQERGFIFAYKRVRQRVIDIPYIIWTKSIEEIWDKVTSLHATLFTKTAHLSNNRQSQSS